MLVTYRVGQGTALCYCAAFWRAPRTLVPQYTSHARTLHTHRLHTAQEPHDANRTLNVQHRPDISLSLQLPLLRLRKNGRALPTLLVKPYPWPPYSLLSLPRSQPKRPAPQSLILGSILDKILCTYSNNKTQKLVYPLTKKLSPWFLHQPCGADLQHSVSSPEPGRRLSLPGAPLLQAPPT